MEAIDEMTKSYVEVLLSKGERADRRGAFEIRPIEVKKGIIESSDGSAWVKWGETQVLASVKFDIATPFPDRPTEGVLSTTAELLPMANPRFEPGPPDERAIELARVVDRAIRSAEIIDLKSMFIEEGRVYAVYIDIYVLDYDGNYIDAASLAAMAALRDARVPPVKDGKLNREEKGVPLKLSGNALEFTFVKVGNHLILDPSLDEERALDTRITIGVCGDLVCSIQKTGRGAITRAELDKMIDVSFGKFKELEKYL
ncbi:MAG: exosome complex protein Rrp42 [Candidatus Micrarchaeia archaeon]